LFVVSNLPVRDGDTLRIEQISLFLGKDYIISFYEGKNDPFEPVRQRLRTRSGKIREQGADYLLYTILDIIIDAGFPVLEDLGERIEDLEDELLDNPDKESLNQIHRLKRELLLLRRTLWPQREALNNLFRLEKTFIAETTVPYLRDCYDHSVLIMDLIENYREMAASMLDVYLSSVSYKLNDVMRVLTVIATLFIPPTFIVGVYGMNFNPKAGPLSMPELNTPYGYLVVWIVIVLMIIGLLVFFKRKKWF
jgi:magnesium transporter